MVSESTYELCLPVLKDEALDEEEKTDKLEEILAKDTALEGRSLQDAILSVLWRFRDATTVQPATSPRPRIAVPRRGSPAPWQVPRAATPLASPMMSGASPASSQSFFPSSSFSRGRQSAASPFSSPKPSPRLPFSSLIPHSPKLSVYELNDTLIGSNDYGDYGSDTVDWLVNDEDTSRPTSSSATSAFESNLSAAAAPWTQPQQTEMSPYDMLRSILGESKTDEEIETALEANGYDLSATVTSFMDTREAQNDTKSPASNGQVIVGKNMQATQPISIAQKNAPGKSPVICKYWLATGNCLRSDCRFSHEYGNHLCKYWIMGNCLAGDTCVFSHDPSALMANLNMSNSQSAADSGDSLQPSLQVRDFDSSPRLSATATSWSPGSGLGNSTAGAARGHGLGSQFATGASARQWSSRPSSRPSSRSATPSIPSVDDNEAFPALSAGGLKATRKHHGKRGGQGHSSNPKEIIPEARLSPVPSPSLLRRGLIKSRTYGNPREHHPTAIAIPAPVNVPWLDMGDGANHAYIKARQDAFKHGGLRNKFLQSAAQAWNRNDARAAKALSLRGQSENELMRKAHREAARLLYEHCSQQAPGTDPNDREVYIDLHGLHPEEAVSYLFQILQERKTAATGSSEASRVGTPTDPPASSRLIYVITGTGHQAKGAKDKVGKAIRTWLVERGFIFREFNVPGDRGNIGGILGVDMMTGSIDAGELTRTGHGRNESVGSATMDTNAEDDRSRGGRDEATSVDIRPTERPVVQMRIPTGPKGLRV